MGGWVVGWWFLGNSYVPVVVDLVTRWTTNTTVDQPVDVVADFIYGQSFAFQMNVWLSSSLFMSNIPNVHAFVGYAEGDFSHTGTVLGATILDGNGVPLLNPQMVAHSGFNYLNPAAVPEPASGGLLLAGVMLLVRRRRRR